MKLTQTKTLADKETFDWFRDKVFHHRSQAKKLHKFRNYQKALDLVEEVTYIEIEILKCFGLPETFEYTSIIDLFSWREEVDEFDIKELYRMLKETAECYLLSPAMGDKKILIEAKERHLTANDFYLKIGIESNLYNVFLYETMFYNNDFEVGRIHSEMKKGNTITPDFAVKMNTGLLLKGKLNNKAHRIGLLFWKQFVEQKKTEKQKPKKKEIQYLDIVRNGYYGLFPSTFSFDEGYINSIEYFETDTPYAIVELITSLDLSMIPIRVYMPFNETISMLKKADNHSTSSVVRSMLFENLNGNKEFTNKIQVREWNKTYLYFKGFEMNVLKYDIEVNSVHKEDHNFYKLNSINDNSPFNNGKD